VSKSLKVVERTVCRSQEEAAAVLEFSAGLSDRTSEFEQALRQLFSASSEQVGIAKFTDLSTGSG
jgi:hypothetical protein